MLPLLLATCLLVSPDDTLARQVHAYLTLGDAKSAVKHVKEAMLRYPSSTALQKSLIHALAQSGDEEEMLRAWSLYGQSIEPAEDRASLCEEMAWGILKKGGESSTLTTRLFALIGATLTQDARAVPFLKEGLRHSSSIIRFVSTQLCPLLRDAPLKEEILHVIEEEKILTVRLGAIEAAGKMRLFEALPPLRAILIHDRTSMEEKAAAAEATASIIDAVTDEEIAALAASDRAGLRLLACQFHFEFGKLGEFLLFHLFNDPRPEVRAAAVSAYGMLRAEKLDERLYPLLSDSDPLVAITAAWSALKYGDNRGLETLVQSLAHSQEETRCLAASALASSGRYGQEALKEAHDKALDPLMKANLALGLAALRQHTESACASLRAALQSSRLLMWKRQGMFETLTFSTLRHSESTPSLPETSDQLVRLRILHVLSVLQDPGAKQALRHFLKERLWGVSSVAAALLLQEGDGADADLVSELLDDPDPKIRLQAALLLASWVRDPSAISTLQEGYFTADKEARVKILEALGTVGDKSSLPFLLERLEEPFLTQRIVAASSLIRCINH